MDCTMILRQLQVNLNQQSESYYGEDPIIKMDGGIDQLSGDRYGRKSLFCGIKMQGSG